MIEGIHFRPAEKALQKAWEEYYQEVRFLRLDEIDSAYNGFCAGFYAGRDFVEKTVEADKKTLYIDSIEYPHECTVFSLDNDVIACIHINDASWRGEYLNGIFEEMGVDIIEGQKQERARDIAVKWFGL